MTRGHTPLTQRWTAARLAGLRGALIEQSRVVRPPHHLQSPWGTIDGRTDLRGIVHDQRDLAIAHLTLQGVDLSFTGARLVLRESEFSNGRFDDLRAQPQSFFGRRFTECSFRNSRLPQAHLSGAFEDCDFTGTTLRAAHIAPNTTFVRCHFTRTSVSGATLFGARFVDCDFEGLTTSWKTVFEHCDFTGSVPDLGNARMRKSTFDRIPLPDRWHGETAAKQAWGRLIGRYIAAGPGRVDHLPHEPEA